jgi:hypothetical protein
MAYSVHLQKACTIRTITMKETMRTNHDGVTETAHIRTDIDKFAEGWERIFGKKKAETDESSEKVETEEDTQRNVE